MNIAVRALALAFAASLTIATPGRAIDPNLSRVDAAEAPIDEGGERRGFLSGVFGCEASGNKRTGTTIVGGAIGGLLGNRIAGRGSRTLGTIIGGALGAAAGSAVGCKLQRDDQIKAERAMEDAIASGEDQDWTSESGASGRVDVSSSTGAGLADLRFDNDVEPADGYTKVGASYVATAAANIRSRPAVEGRKLGALTVGQRVWVPASVQGAPWLLISDQGVGQGYVSNALLRREATQTASACRMVKQTVDVPGSGTASETYQACKGKDGAWVLTRV